MILFRVTRQFIGKDQDEEVIEYHLAENEEKFIVDQLRYFLEQEVVTSNDRKNFDSDEEFQFALAEWQEYLKQLLRSRKIEDVDHEFWREDVTWTSTDITEAEIETLRKFDVIFDVLK